jgi:hypothetical protein
MSGAGLRTFGIGAMFAVLLVVAEMRYAEPIRDSDLFWHLAYAQQMVTEGTLQPDPKLYSWTPTSDGSIYCAWLAELALYAVWSVAGFAGLFALRYLVIAGIALLFWTTLRRAHLSTGPPALLVLLLLVVTAYPGSLIKPELFSLLFFHGVLYAYFGAKRTALEGGDPRPWLYAVPLITLVWANAHGGHVLLAPLLVATAAGEALNRRFSPKLAFSGSQLSHLLAAWALCAVAVCLTPYGIAYPLQHLAEVAAGGSARPDTVWNTAYQTIYAEGALDFLSLPQIFAGLAVALIAAMVVLARQSRPGGRFDYALGFGLVAYLPLSVMIVRTAYFWPALACYALLHLAYLKGRADVPPLVRVRSWFGKSTSALTLAAFFSLAASTAYDAYARPGMGSWLGFGVGYSNPVPEAEYLARARLGTRFYNTFDSGGYLLWRLYPEYRVMVDPRSFPYLDWFADQYDFANGRRFAAFLAKYPADVAIIDLQKVGCWWNFLHAPDWRLLFFGPTAAVFARKTVATDQKEVQVAGELLELDNAQSALAAFDFALAAGAYDIAWKILDQIETRLRRQTDAADLARLQAYRAAHAALSRGALDEAHTQFERALAYPVAAARDQLILRLLRDRAKYLRRGELDAAQAVSVRLGQMASAVAIRGD